MAKTATSTKPAVSTTSVDQLAKLKAEVAQLEKEQRRQHIELDTVKDLRERRAFLKRKSESSLFLRQVFDPDTEGYVLEMATSA